MIIFDQVTKQFTPDSFGVHDVSFQVEPGEFVLLTGKSGAGKTTLMRLLTKEYTPTEGTIVFEDADLDDISYGKVHLLRRKIGVVFQDYRLLPELNVWENIALPLSIVGQPQGEIEERVTDLLRLINLPDKADLFPSQLSGGEAQRVSIARALANGPSVIFADEPTGNLDKETSESIGRLLKKINELGTTILFATHDQSVLDLFKEDRHLHMEKGKLIKDSHAHRKAAAATAPKADAQTEKSADLHAPKHPKPAKKAPAPHDSTSQDEPKVGPGDDAKSADDRSSAKLPGAKGPFSGFFGLFGKRKPTEHSDHDDDESDDRVGKQPEPAQTSPMSGHKDHADAPKKIKVQVKTESLDE